MNAFAAERAATMPGTPEEIRQQAEQKLRQQSRPVTIENLQAIVDKQDALDDDEEKTTPKTSKKTQKQASRRIKTTDHIHDGAETRYLEMLGLQEKLLRQPEA